MRRRAALLILAASGASACRDRHSASSTKAAASAAVVPSSRVVCAAVQGPTKVGEQLPDGAAVASLDGRIALHRVSREAENHVPVEHAELRAQGEPATTVPLPHGGRDLAPGAYAFRGANVIGFGAERHFLVGGDNAFIVWATLTPRAVSARSVHSAFVDRGAVYFTDAACKMHVIDATTGAERTGARIGSATACPPFRIWDGAIAIGKTTFSGSGSAELSTGIDFGERVVDFETGKARAKPFCPRTVGAGSCVTFDGDLRVEFDEDPAGPESSASRSEGFEVRGPHGEVFRGKVTIPHYAISPDHEVLWRDTRSRAVTFVASRVDGFTGPQLVAVDDERIALTSLAPEDAVDHRRIAALRSFVPYRTPPEKVDELLRARERSLAEAETDHVRFMEYSAAASAHVPCSAPPR